MNEQSGSIHWSAEHQAAQHTTTGVLSTSKYASIRHQCQAQPALRQRTEEYFLSCRCQRIARQWLVEESAFNTHVIGGTPSSPQVNSPIVTASGRTIKFAWA